MDMLKDRLKWALARVLGVSAIWLETGMGRFSQSF